MVAYQEVVVMCFITIYKEGAEAGVKRKEDKFRKALCDGKAGATLGEHLAGCPSPQWRGTPAVNTEGNKETFLPTAFSDVVRKGSSSTGPQRMVLAVACTHRNPRVLVQDDLEQMRRENGWCFKPFFWF